MTTKSCMFKAGLFLCSISFSLARPQTYAGFQQTVTPTPPVSSGQTRSHGPYTGSATVTGALTASTVLGTTIPTSPPPAAATTYPADGQLHNAQPIPYAPGGGIGTNGTTPVYRPRSDFDYQSLVCSYSADLVKCPLSHFLFILVNIH